MAPLALAQECRGFGEVWRRVPTDLPTVWRECGRRPRLGAVHGRRRQPGRNPREWARGTSRVPPLRAAAVAKRSLTVPIARPFVAHLGRNSGTIIAGPKSRAWPRAPGIAIFRALRRRHHFGWDWISSYCRRAVRPCAPGGGWDVRFLNTAAADAHQRVDRISHCFEHAGGRLHWLYQPPRRTQHTAPQ